MTLGEYIELLKKLPQDMIVVRTEYKYCEGDWSRADILPEDISAGKDGAYFVVNGFYV